MRKVFCPDAGVLPCQITSVAWGRPGDAQALLAGHNYLLAPAMGNAEETRQFALLEAGTLNIGVQDLHGLFVRSNLINYFGAQDVLLDRCLGCFDRPQIVAPPPAAIPQAQAVAVDRPVIPVADDADPNDLQVILGELRDYRRRGDFTLDYDCLGLMYRLREADHIEFPERSLRKIYTKFTETLEEARATPDANKNQAVAAVHLHLENYLRFLAIDDADNIEDGGMGVFHDFNPNPGTGDAELDEVLEHAFGEIRVDSISEDHYDRLCQIGDAGQVRNKLAEFTVIHLDYNCWKLLKMFTYARGDGVLDLRPHLEMNDAADHINNFERFLPAALGDEGREGKKTELDQRVIDDAFNHILDNYRNFLSEAQIRNLNGQLRVENRNRRELIEKMRELLGRGWVELTGI